AGIIIILAVLLLAVAAAVLTRTHCATTGAILSRRWLLLLGCGTSGIRFCPALCVTAEQVAAALAILGEVAT
ncbi:MAG TPA: hypothetical protein PK867_04575, partial [Pirellulales bacterium]|nr:hypothetical protein [Pirellulales bacterium]